MCGISAVIIKKNAVQNLRDGLVRMTDAIKHRGPDDEGYLIINHNNDAFCFGGNDTKVYLAESNIPYLPKTNINEKSLENNTKIALGFRRLSILDLSPTGHQPMSYLNGRYWIVFNGEIYNYVEIKQDLVKNGYIFKSNTDTEVILAAYDHWGIECLNKFNGMWAIILYDSLKNEIFIARDRFGIKPLYFYRDSDLILFGSEIKQFLSFGNININPNIEKIEKDFPFDSQEQTHETPFTNVFRFPNASWSKISLEKTGSSEIKFEKYYNLTYHRQNNYDKFSDNQALNISEEYRFLLEDSIKLRLRSDVNIGTCFSGGLDSSSIVYFVNKLLNNNSKQRTFSLVFNTAKTNYCDESKYINELVTELNLQSYRTEPEVNDVIENYDKMLFALDTPQSYNLMSYFFTYKLVRNNNTIVTLDGQGADELQAGYLPYLINYFSNLPFKELYKEYDLFIKNPESFRQISRGILLKFLRAFRSEKLVNYTLKQKEIRRDPFLDLNTKLFEDFNTDLQTLFHYGDRGSMLNSVESRFPMMDYRIVEFWFNLPYKYKLCYGYTKYIARLAMNNKLPDNITWRRDKKGWETPIYEWLKNGLYDKMKPVIQDSYLLKHLNISNSNYLRIALNSKNFNSKKFIKFYNHAAWYRAFFNRAG
jgi:asparagine synthase (glutamine-hydrolysing)